MSMDARMVREIEELGDQPSSWLEGWGGPSGYVFWSRQTEPRRMTYFAIREGYNTVGDIASVLGYRESQVNDIVRWLVAQGLVEAGEVSA